MHKNLHKDLFSKRKKKKIYPPVNNLSITPSDNVDNETEKNVAVVSKKKYNLLSLFTTLIASGLIIFGYSIFRSSSQTEINLLSIEQIDTISENSISNTTSTSSTTTSTSSTTTLITTTTSILS